MTWKQVEGTVVSALARANGWARGWNKPMRQEKKKTRGSRCIRAGYRPDTLLFMTWTSKLSCPCKTTSFPSASSCRGVCTQYVCPSLHFLPTMYGDEKSFQSVHVSHLHRCEKCAVRVIWSIRCNLCAGCIVKVNNCKDKISKDNPPPLLPHSHTQSEVLLHLCPGTPKSLNRVKKHKNKTKTRNSFFFLKTCPSVSAQWRCFSLCLSLLSGLWPSLLCGGGHWGHLIVIL